MKFFYPPLPNPPLHKKRGGEGIYDLCNNAGQTARRQSRSLPSSALIEWIPMSCTTHFFIKLNKISILLK